MAIRVVQGLIDVGTPQIQGRLDPARAQTQSANQTQQQNSQQALIQQSQQQSVALQQSGIVHSEAALATIRSSRPHSEDEKIRDPEKADEVAESLAERIDENEDEAGQAHASLNATNARQHFA